MDSLIIEWLNTSGLHDVCLVLTAYWRLPSNNRLSAHATRALASLGLAVPELVRAAAGSLTAFPLASCKLRRLERLIIPLSCSVYITVAHWISKCELKRWFGARFGSQPCRRFLACEGGRGD
jgi:hypothetical protein